MFLIITDSAFTSSKRNHCKPSIVFLFQADPWRSLTSTKKRTWATTTGYVEVYDAENKWIHRLGTPPFTFTKPTDIAIDELRFLAFVVDGQENIVQVFDLQTGSGQHLGTIPAGGPNVDQLTHPTGIAIDTTNQKVFISDFGDTNLYIPPRVQIFDYDGKLLDTLSGKAGFFGVRFSRPQGLAVDHRGHLFIVDSFNGRVFAYDIATKTEVANYGEFGTQTGQLSLPLDVVYDFNKQRIYVTNNQAARVEVFDTRGVTP